MTRKLVEMIFKPPPPKKIGYLKKNEKMKKKSELHEMTRKLVEMMVCLSQKKNRVPTKIVKNETHILKLSMT